MHNYFAAWLKGANVQLTDGVARSRWAAVEALVHWATESGKAVRLSAPAIAVASISAEQRQEISQVLQGGDASFAMIGNDAELQVLAASAVVQLLVEEGPVADAAALSVGTGTFGNREPEAAPGLAQLAHDYLSRRAVTARIYDDAPRDSAFAPRQAAYIKGRLNTLSKDLASDGEEQDADDGLASATAVEALGKIVASLTGYLEQVATDESIAHNRLVRAQAAFSEETNILWWVINGYSQDLSRPRGQASAAELTLPSARELAHLVTHGVPPAASIEYLRRALSSAEGGAPDQLTIAEVMEAAAPDWRESATVALPEGGPDHLFPVLTGLRIVDEGSGNDDWKRIFRDRTGLAGDFTAAPEEIGIHLLRELSLGSCLVSSAPD